MRGSFCMIKEKLIEKIEWMLTVIVLSIVIYGSYTLSKNMVKEVVHTENMVVVLDAGHGGSDPGKIGINEVLEKDVNLAIVLKIREMLEKEGIGCVLTRVDDERVDENGKELSKAADMKERVRIMNEVHPKLVVSVHQNSYTSSEIKGAQVFYYESSTESEKIAEIIQEELCKVDSSNTRKIKGNSTYYLLKRTEVPAVIVECGFLSNPEEAEKLATEEYQKKMAEAIVKGIKSYLEIEED